MDRVLSIKYFEPKAQVRSKENKTPLISNGGEAKCRMLALLENMGLRQSTVFQAPYVQYNCILTFLILAKVGLAKQ